MSKLQPKTTQFEWGGPVGGALMVILLPLLVFGVHSLCAEESCTVLMSLEDVGEMLFDGLVDSLSHLPEALAIEIVWMIFHAVFYLLPIGRVIQGSTLRNGKVLSYRINAIHAFALCHVMLIGLHFAEYLNLCYLCEIYSSLMLGSIIISAVMSLVLYVASFRSDDVLTALGGNSGNFFYDFWIGRELNPRIGFLDLKFMCELRPGLIGWSLLNWCFVLFSLQHGSFSPSIAFISFFHTFYCLDGLLLEAGNLTMMDITTDGFGFMLCFGDLAWVPFIYTIQTKYLCYHPVQLPWYGLAASVALVVVGYALFRGSNTEKDRFRSNPNDPRVKHLKVMKTSAGKSLIISGYWGTCRHPNYLGDWLMALGWACFVGPTALLPFFHPIYFGALLLHRQLRDEAKMEEKYGEKDWKKFCGIVKYRLIPYVY